MKAHGSTHDHAKAGPPRGGQSLEGSGPTPFERFLGLQSVIGNQVMSGLLGGAFPRATPGTQREGSPFDLVHQAGGRIETGSEVDAQLRRSRARAATLGDRVLLRSDIAARPKAASTWWTLAHEAAHVLQQRHVKGQPSPTREDSGALWRAESDANRAADALLGGRTPLVSHREAAPVMRFLLDDSEFEPPENDLDLAAARNDALWVEANIKDYSVTVKPPYTFTVFYSDGNKLEIPLTKMSFERIGGLTFFRRHKKTGRLVPFKISLKALPSPESPETRKLTAQDFHTLVPVRFDTDLTPLIMAQLDEAQTRLLAMKFLGNLAVQAGGIGPAKAPIESSRGIGAKLLAERVAKQQAARTSITKAGAQAAGETAAGEAAAGKVAAEAAAPTAAKPGAQSTGAKAATEVTEGKVAAEAGEARSVPTVVAAGADIAKVTEELLAATASIKNNGKRFIRAAAILSSRIGLSALEKAKAIEKFAEEIGFGFSKEGLVDEGAHLLLYSEGGKGTVAFFVFKFVKDTGRIWYGKYDQLKMDVVWTLLE